jgi:hypothetical protein
MQDILTKKTHAGAIVVQDFWEASGRHLGNNWEAFVERYLEARRLWEASWRYLGCIWRRLGES